MPGIKKALREKVLEDVFRKKIALFEHQRYSSIPGTNSSYREDPANTNTMTQKHSHVYARRNGGGKQLYSVNIDGSGHDGFSGIEIPKKHADFFRDTKNYEIPSNNILESLDFGELNKEKFTLLVLTENDI